MADDDIKKQLLEMGFSDAQISKAISSTNARTLEEAINWIVSHEDDDATPMEVDKPVYVSHEGESEATSPAGTGDNNETSVQEAKSIKCNECGKCFALSSQVETHATKTGHVDFSESTEVVKPLTEEEKRAKREALEQKIKEKRALNEEAERQKAIEMEKKRRLQGQEIAIAKQKLQEKEMMEIAEERRRQKREDLLAKQRVLNQIKADREAKKREATGEVAPSKPTEVVKPPTHKPDYKVCKLQIRLPDGSALVHEFGADEELAAVRLYVEMNRKDGSEPFNLMTNFPKKVFSEQEMATPLKVLGLVPSAVLIATKAVPMGGVS